MRARSSVQAGARLTFVDVILTVSTLVTVPTCAAVLIVQIETSSAVFARIRVALVEVRFTMHSYNVYKHARHYLKLDFMFYSEKFNVVPV